MPATAASCSSVVPTSLNFPVSEVYKHGLDFREHLHQSTTSAGDVILFSEATVHGALPWVAQHERRVAVLRFAPATCAYGRAYAEGWPPEMLEGLTPQERAVMEPP